MINSPKSSKYKCVSLSRVYYLLLSLERTLIYINEYIEFITIADIRITKENP